MQIKEFKQINKKSKLIIQMPVEVFEISGVHEAYAIKITAQPGKLVVEAIDEAPEAELER